MSAPNVTVSIDRTGMTGAPPPLVLSGNDDATTWGVADLRLPGRIRRNIYAPSADNINGEELYATSLQQGLISMEAFPSGVSSEAALEALVQELTAAIDRASFVVDVTFGNASPKSFDCHFGSIALAAGGRTLGDLLHTDPVYVVTIPCYPNW